MNRTFQRASIVLALVGLALTACGGSSPTSLESNNTNAPYGSLFDTPSGSATPDQLAGLWGGTAQVGTATMDIRLRFGASDLTAATRCAWTDGTTLTAGAKGKTRTTPAPKETCTPLGTGASSCGEVETLESVTDKRTLGDKWCQVSFTPRAYEYTISGTKGRLRIGADELDLVKLSD